MKPTCRVVPAALVIGVLVGCAGPSRQPSPDETADVCPETVQNEIRMRASVVPREVPRELTVGEGVDRRYAVLGRRLLVAVVAEGSAERLQILESSLSIAPFGGTFAGWAAIDGTTAAVDVIPGRLRVTPFLASGRLLARTVTVDTIIQAGGAPLEQAVVTTGPLWDEARKPLPPDRVRVTLTPVRHFSSFDAVSAKLVLDFRARAPRAQSAWHCSAETQLVLVDREAARPPLWDLGTSHRGGARKLWLALYDPKTGPVRAIFGDPVAARGFATWASQIGATRVGAYDLGVFQQEDMDDPTAVVPADQRIMESYRRVTPENLAELKVGPLAAP